VYIDTCALQAKVLRCETPPEVARTIGQTLKNLMAQGALHLIAVLREDNAPCNAPSPI
jgi:hypothetical protein